MFMRSFYAHSEYSFFPSATTPVEQAATEVIGQLMGKRYNFMQAVVKVFKDGASKDVLGFLKFDTLLNFWPTVVSLLCEDFEKKIEEGDKHGGKREKLVKVAAHCKNVLRKHNVTAEQLLQLSSDELCAILDKAQFERTYNGEAIFVKKFALVGNYVVNATPKLAEQWDLVYAA